MAPSATTGIASLPDGTARAVVEELDARVRGDSTDGELAWMLAWYVAGGRFVLEVYGATARLLAFAESTSPDAWRSQTITDDSMRQRGQMGYYWTALAREGRS
jgi:hypothetical protein